MSAHKFTTSIFSLRTGDVECEVCFDYSPGRPGVHTLRNGDPGYPDDPAELEITAVMVDGEDVMGRLSEETLTQLTEQADDYMYQLHEADEAAQYEAWVLSRDNK